MKRPRLARWGAALLFLGAIAVALPSLLPRVADGGRGVETVGDADRRSSGMTAIRPEELTSVVFVPRPGADAEVIARRHGLDPGALSPPGALGEYQVKVPYERAGSLVDALRNDSDVLLSEGPQRVTLFASPRVPNDDGYHQRDLLTFFEGRKQWALRRINPEAAWGEDPVRKDDVDLLVIVADTGVDGDHDDLRLGAAYPDTLEQPRKPYYPDRPGLAWHGTAVAGAVAAVSDNDKGIASPSWDQTVTSWNLFGSGDIYGSYRLVHDEAQVAGRPETAGGTAPDPKRVIFNGSFGRCDPETKECLEHGYALEAEMLRKGMESGRVLWVMAAGNENHERVAFPARYPYVLAVGGTDASDGKARTSSHGVGLDIAAPGVDVFTTQPGDSYDYASGTSFAAPLVSGVAAALWKREPLLTSQQVMKRLLASTGESRSEKLGYGLVDMDQAFVLDQAVPSVKIERRPAATGAGASFALHVVDDLDGHGLAVIDETVELEEGRGTSSWKLDFAKVPTSAIDTVKWSIDGGPWHEVPINRSDVQRYDQSGPEPCQVCAQIDIPAEELALVSEHRLTVRAWDSSPKEGTKYGEAQMTFNTDAVPDRGEGTSTALLVDSSGSMSERFDQTTKIDAAKRAAISFLDLVAQAQGVGGTHATALVAFASSATVRPALTSDVAGLKAAVQRLGASGGTDIGSAIRDGLAEVRRGVGARSMVLLSDGLPTSGQSVEQILAGPVAEAQRLSIPIHTIAVGETSGSNRPFLEQIARRTGGVSSVASTPAELVFQYVSAEHRSSGTVLFEGHTPQIDLRVPRVAGALRISAFSATGSLPAISVTSPSGVRYPVDSGAQTAGAGAGVAQLSVPKPAAGVWRLESSRAVDVVASAQPLPTEEASTHTQVPDDPEPPVVAALAATEARTVTAPPAAFTARVGGAGAMGAGAVLLVLGRYLPVHRPGPRRSKPPRRRSPPPPSQPDKLVLQPTEVHLNGARAACACGQVLRGSESFCGKCGTPLTPALRLEVLRGPDLGQWFRARPGDIVGRGQGATLHLSDARVSRRHLQVRLSAGSWTIVDLGSTGGTTVNGGRKVEHALQVGDEIGLGVTVLVVRR